MCPGCGYIGRRKENPKLETTVEEVELEELNNENVKKVKI